MASIKNRHRLHSFYFLPFSAFLSPSEREREREREPRQRRMTKKRERVKPRNRSILTNKKPRSRTYYPNQEPIIPATTTANNCTTSHDHESIGFTTLLSLDSFNSISSSNNSQPHTDHHHTPCVDCGRPGSSSSNKYCSPDRPQDQLTKKIFLDPEETTTTTSVPSIHRFSKIALAFPSTSSTHNKNIQSQGTDATLPALRRCSSDPCSPPLANLVPRSPPHSSDMAGSNALSTPASKRSASLLPRPPMRRSVSNPSPDKRYSLSSSSSAMGLDESSSCQWLRRMKDSMEEINQLWDEIMLHLVDEDYGDEGTEENTMNDAIKSDSVGDCEEAVSVQKTGDCMILRFKCPCGKGNQILLSGGNCYYKLM